MRIVRALAVILTVAGCQVEADMGIEVRNDTSATVVVKTVKSDGTLTSGTTLAPGAVTFAGQSGCLSNVKLRAFSTDGQQIQAKDGLCADDTWHINATPTTPPPTTTTPPVETTS